MRYGLSREGKVNTAIVEEAVHSHDLYPGILRVEHEYCGALQMIDIQVMTSAFSLGSAARKACACQHF